MAAKQTEKTIYRTVDKNTQDKNTVKQESRAAARKPRDAASVLFR